MENVPRSGAQAEGHDGKRPPFGGPGRDQGSPQLGPPQKKPNPFLIGSLAGCCSATLAAPLDLVKVRIQTTASSSRSPGSAEGTPARPPPSILRTISKIYRTEGGLRGFFPGYSAVLSRQIVYKGAVLGSYDVFLEEFSQKSGSSGPRVAVLSSVCAALVGSVVGNPVDRALVFRQTQEAQHINCSREHVVVTTPVLEFVHERVVFF